MKRLAVQISAFLEQQSYRMSILALLAITVASLLPMGSLGDPGAVGVRGSIVHIVAYGTLIFLRAVTPSVPLVWPLATVFAWSVMLEALQFLIGRSASFADVAFIAVGIIVGLVIGYTIRRLLAWLLR